MKGFIISTVFFSISMALANCQYTIPFDGSSSYGMEKYVDPFILQSLKLKYPNKYVPKLTCARDLALEAKYKLASKLIARQLKNLNGNYNLQNQMYGYGQTQPLVVQPIMFSGQPSILSQQQQQQPQVSTFQYQFDPIKAATFAPSVESQAALSRMTDPRFQQSAIMPPGSLSSLHPQQTVLHTPVPVHLQRNE